MESSKSSVIRFRLSGKLRRALEIMSTREGVGMSEMIRHLIREGARVRGLYAIGLIDALGEKEIEIQGVQDVIE